MPRPPTYTIWKISCRSSEDVQDLQQWLSSRVDLERLVTDVVRVFAGGMEKTQAVRHRLGDYFAGIRMLPDAAGGPPSFRLVFHRRPDAGPFWKDLMVNVLQEIEAAPQNPSVELDSKGELEPSPTTASSSQGGVTGMAEQELRQVLVNRPRESLDFELKQWIDPTTPEGKAKIAKACIALRNNDGGRLVIGFKNDGTADVGHAPGDVQASFHIDVIQGIVSKYSSEAFSVDVKFIDVSGQTYPVITVPPGVRTPVAAKSDLKDPGGKRLIRDHTVYVRSLTSNNTVSSSDARRGDWEALARICFNNREADIGAFVRRHLSALKVNSLAALISSIGSIGNQPSYSERIAEELKRGRSRFEAACHERKLPVADLGYRESLIIVDGEFPQQTASLEFRDRLLRNAPSHTGWPPWVDLSDSGHSPDRSYVLDDGWEALVECLTPATAIAGLHLDFWRLETRGVFYHVRGLEDDLNQSHGVAPQKQLDFLLQIARTAEVISTGLSFARSLGCKDETTSLIFGFRWTHLKGRILSSWVEPRRLVRGTRVSRQDEFATHPLVVPLDTPPSGIAPHVENVVKGLFALFEGAQFSGEVIEGIVADTVSRRM